MRAIAAIGLGGLLLAGTAFAGDAPAGDADAGRKLARMCATCHGVDGYAKIPIAPHIGGEPAAYIDAQLRAFRDGSREHEMMTVVARGLDDTQIANLSAWYAAQLAVATLPAGASPEAAPETCVACHGADGMALAPDVPNLAGETNIYIDTQLKAFRNGKRVHEVMTEIASDMTDAEIRAAADWYAAVRLKISKPK